MLYLLFVLSAVVHGMFALYEMWHGRPFFELAVLSLLLGLTADNARREIDP